MICNKCNGNKYIIGVGYMKKKCPVCDGLGAIFTHDGLKKRADVILDDLVMSEAKASVALSNDPDGVHTIHIPEKPKKKRGRPKKAQ